MSIPVYEILQQFITYKYKQICHHFPQQQKPILRYVKLPTTTDANYQFSAPPANPLHINYHFLKW